jgi:hypothetical protein
MKTPNVRRIETKEKKRKREDYVHSRRMPAFLHTSPPGA